MESNVPGNNCVTRKTVGLHYCMRLTLDITSQLQCHALHLFLWLLLLKLILSMPLYPLAASWHLLCSCTRMLPVYDASEAANQDPRNCLVSASTTRTAVPAASELRLSLHPHHQLQRSPPLK